MQDFFHALRRHHDSPNMQHMRPFLDDLISVMEDRENNFKRRMEQYMSALSDQLTQVVSDLGVALIAHDTAVQAALVKLQQANSAGDSAAVTTAVNAIASASSRVAAETKLLTEAMAAAIPAAVADPAAGADPAVAAAAPAPASPNNDPPAPIV